MNRYHIYVSEDSRLMAEWDWEENINEKLKPEKITIGSGKKANWICSKGHKWAATIDHRIRRGSNCPVCSNRKILSGYNDLKSKRPDLMVEWDYENNSIDPSTIAPQSNKVANWICPKGHKYKKRICNRYRGEECPICCRARRTSFPEQCFYYYIKKVYPDAINSYREIFDGGMELDIYIPSIKTGIEYDGIFWHGKEASERENRKYKICKEKQIRLFRIKEGTFSGFSDNADRIWFIPKKSNYQEMDFYITNFLKHLSFFSTKLPFVDVENDKKEILEYKTLKVQESLSFKYPEVAKEWNYGKNGKLTPDLFIPGSTEKVWWCCSKCGNEWKTSIVNRTKGHGCDICATTKRKLTKKITLLSERGGIDKEWCLLDWDYKKNTFGPEHYTNGSGVSVHWRCHICGHEWMTPICNRTREYKNGCPLCLGKTIVSGVNDLPTVAYELLQDWDYEKNTIDPKTVGKGSHAYALWKCHKCKYQWTAQIYNRANGKGCPCCSNRIIVPGKNDLETTNPELAAEWHPTLNLLKPTEVSRGQSIKVFWICAKCGNVWQDSLNHRSGGRGCSKCKKSGRY